MRFVAALLMVIAFAACDLGSKSIGIEYYRFDYDVIQVADSPAGPGAVVVGVTTDLPDGTYVEGMLTEAKTLDEAKQGAVLIGSTSDPLSQVIKRKKPADTTVRFTLSIYRPVASTCHNLPPCGPFPAGSYTLLIDVVNPVDNASNGGASVLDDPHYTTNLHGFRGGAGLEYVKTITVGPLPFKLDENGRSINTSPKKP